MGFSLQPVADVSRAPQSAAATAPAIAGQAGSSDTWLFADLFAGQLGGVGSSVAANDLGAALGLVASPASLLPQPSAPQSLADRPLPTVDEQTLSSGRVDDALLAQVQAAFPLPVAKLTPPVTDANAEPASDAASPAVLVPDAATAAATQAGLQVPPAQPSRRDAPLERTGTESGLPAAQALPELARQLDTSQAGQSPRLPEAASAVPSLLALSPAEREALARRLQAGTAQPANTHAGPSAPVTQPGVFLQAQQSAAQAGQGDAMRQPWTPASDSMLPARQRNEVLPADVRLMFRREAAQATADMAANQELSAGSQRQMLPPLLTAPASASTPATGDWRIAQPMADTPQWREAFGQKLGSMVSMNVDSASIQVNPEQLGPLDISIRFDQQDRAMISVVAANVEAKSIVENSLPQLAKLLEQGGIQLGSTQVSTQQQASQQAQQQAQEQARQQSGQHGQQRHGAARQPDETRLEREIAASGQHHHGLSIQA